jgi:hypothetical protein
LDNPEKLGRVLKSGNFHIRFHFQQLPVASDEKLGPILKARTLEAKWMNRHALL